MPPALAPSSNSILRGACGSIRSIAELGFLLLGLLVAAPGHACAQDSQQSPPVQGAPPPQSADADRAQAFNLYNQNKFEEALPLFQSLAASHPNDAAVFERLGGCLFAHSVTLPDPEQRRLTRVEARKAFLRAQELGDKSGYLTIALSNIPEDGGSAVFSSRADVDAAMREAETAFAHGDFAGAIAGYAKVLILDPLNYDATLFTGDTYFKQNDWPNSCVWFEKAVALGPDRETAYRYWGDALFRSGKDEEAREKYVLALVAEPYNKAPWVGLNQWANRNHVKLSQLNIQTPNVTVNADGTMSINLDLNLLGKNDGSSAWIVYGGTRTLWSKSKFKEQFPNEAAYRHSLAEESDALSEVADMALTALKSNKLKPNEMSPQLLVLLKLKQEEMLEAYILISHPDKGIALDYAAYRADHRDKLIQYVHEYILPKAN